MMLRLIICFVLLPASLFAKSAPESFAEIVDQLVPAVVNVSTEHKMPVRKRRTEMFPGIPHGHLFEEFREFFSPFMEEYKENDGERDIISLGSGFIIDKNGTIVTNRHVITNNDGEIASDITITFNDSSQLKAKVLATDSRTDLAVLKVSADREFQYVEFGDSDKARVGDWAIAIGNPFGLGGSVSVGVVSARGRDINIGQQQNSDFIQTDAAINRGNSGGPLFNSEGKVIGINTAIISPSGGSVGIGFSVPSNIASPVIENLAQGKQVQRGWVGVKVQAVTKEIADSIGQKTPQGALIVEVTANSPAEKAGIKVGDVILEFNRGKIERMRNLPVLVGKAKVGSVIDVKVMRSSSKKKQNITLKVKIEKLEELNEVSLTGGTIEYNNLGITVSSLSEDNRKKFSIKDSVKGIVIVNVNRNYNKMLKPGDVITQVGGVYIEDLSQFDTIIKNEQKNSDSVLLLVNRRGENSFIGMKFVK